MKTIKHLSTTILTVCFLCFAAFSLSAQEQPKQALKIKPFTFEFAYERALNKTVSLQLAGRFFPLKVTVKDDEGSSSFGLYNYQLTPEARFYLGKSEALQGFFVAPHVKYGLLKLKGEAESNTDLKESVTYTGQNIGAGLTIGWQWVMGKGFTIDTQFGYGWSRRTFKDLEVVYEHGTREVETASDAELNLMLPRVGFSIGYAF